MDLTEFLGTSGPVLVHSVVREMFEGARHEGSFEFPFQASDGRTLWFQQNSRLWRDGSGNHFVTAVLRDISAYVHSRELIQRSEEKYRGIIQNSSLGLLEVDNDEIIQFANKAFCDFSGYTPSELLGKQADVMLLPKEEEILEKMHEVRDQRSSGVANAYEIRLRRKDGTLAWVLISGAPIFDHEGKVVGSIGIHHDITGQKQESIVRNQLLTEVDERRRILERQQEHLTILNSFAAGLLSRDSVSAVYRHISDSIRGRMGFVDCIVYHVNRSDNQLEHDPAFMHEVEAGSPGFKPMISVPLGSGITGSAALHGRVEMVADTSKDPRYIQDRGIRYLPDGKLFIDLAGTSSRKSELAVPIIYGNTVLGVIDTGHPEVGFFDELHRDTVVTMAGLAAVKLRQLQISVALRESEQRVRSIIDSALDAVLTISQEGNVTEATDQCATMFGRPMSEIIGKKFNLLLAAEDRFPDRFFRNWAGEAGDSAPKTQRIEVGGLKGSGELFQAELSLARIRIQGSVLISVFVRDITLQKQAEIELRTALAREAELNNMKSRFITMTSHEFRTPLTTIQSTAEILFMSLERVPGVLSEKLGKYFKRITGEVERLTNLMNDILVIGRIDAGKISFHPVELDLAVFTHELLDGKQFVRQDPRIVGLKVTGDPVAVSADPILLTHILTNLVSNALKYSPGKKEPEVTIEFRQENVRVCVRDYGIGIPENEVQSIFDSFFRASNAEHIQGTGLGLVIVKQFLDIHNGKLSVTSAMGEGTTFCIELHYLIPASDESSES